MITIGSLDRRILVQRMDTADLDAMGGFIQNFSNWDFFFANVEWTNTSLKETEDKTFANQTVNFIIRNVSDNAMKINAGDNYRIAYPINDDVVDANTQYYTIVGTQIMPGRNTFKKLITKLEARGLPQE
jgi:head-tail adaptor